jgi:adenosine deaminase
LKNSEYLHHWPESSTDGFPVVDDQNLLEGCRKLDVMFTVLPTTTLHTTPWRNLNAPDHAIRRMDPGLRVSINSGDAGLFATNLNREYEMITEAFGLSEDTLAQLTASGFSHHRRPETATDSLAEGQLEEKLHHGQ